MWLIRLILVMKFGVQHQQRKAVLLVQHLFGHGGHLSRIWFPKPELGVAIVG